MTEVSRDGWVGAISDGGKHTKELSRLWEGGEVGYGWEG